MICRPVTSQSVMLTVVRLKTSQIVHCTPEIGVFAIRMLYKKPESSLRIAKGRGCELALLGTAMNGLSYNV